MIKLNNKKLNIKYLLGICVVIIIFLIIYIVYLYNFNKNLIQSSNTSISEQEAIEIYEKYRKDVLLDNSDMFNFVEIKQEKMKVENKYLLSSFPEEYIYRTTLGSNYSIKEDTQEINIYALYYKSDDNSNRMIGYVDISSGEVIGNYQEGI